MAEKLDPELRKLLRWLFCKDWMKLAELLKSRGDPRGDDVLEFVQGVECDPRIEHGHAAAPYVLATGKWWTIRCLANGVTAYLHPRTEQRARSERYGRIAMLSPFVPAFLQYDLRERAAFEGRDVTLAEVEDLQAGQKITAKEVREHLCVCLAGLITLQFGWEPRELDNYEYIVDLEHRTETAAEYDAWLDSEPCLRECVSEGYYQLDEEITNPALPAWMEDLYRGNPGRFWWVMGRMVNITPMRNEAADRVLDRLQRSGLIDPSALPSLLEACVPKNKHDPEVEDDAANELLKRDWAGLSHTAVLRWVEAVGGSDWSVVHGTVLSQTPGEVTEHAWCEHFGNVVDFAQPVDSRLIDRKSYYRAMQPKMCRVYTAEEALLLATKNGHDGPWSESEQLKE